MATGDISSLAVQADGAGITCTIAGLTGAYTTDATKLAAAFVSIATTDPAGNSATKKSAICRITATLSAGNAACTIELAPHSANPTLTPLIDKNATVTITWAAGTFSGTGGSSAALAAASVSQAANTLVYPKAIGGWAMPKCARYAGTIPVDIFATGAWPIASVKVYHSGTSAGGASTLLTTLTSMTAVATPAWLLARALALGVQCPTTCFYWHTDIDISGYTDGRHFLDFVATPIVGSAASVLDTRPLGLNDTTGAGQLEVYCNSGGTLNAETHYFSPSGDDTTGAGTRLSPYKTAQKCYDQTSVKAGGTAVGLAGTHGLHALRLRSMNHGLGEPFYIAGDGAAGSLGSTWDPQSVEYFNAASDSRYCIRNFNIKNPTQTVLDATDSNSHTYSTIRRDGANVIAAWYDGCRFFGADRTTAGQIANGYEFDETIYTNTVMENTAGTLGYARLVRGVIAKNLQSQFLQNVEAFSEVYLNSLQGNAGNHVDGCQMLPSPAAKRTTNIWGYNFRWYNGLKDATWTAWLNIGGNYSRCAYVNGVGHCLDAGGASSSNIAGNGHVVAHCLTLVNEALQISGAGSAGAGVAATDARSYRDLALKGAQYVNAADKPRSAHFANINVDAATGYQGIDAIASSVTTEPDHTVLFNNAAALDFVPAHPSPLKSRVPAGGALTFGDANGTAPLNDGTDAIGALYVPTAAAPIDPITGQGTQRMTATWSDYTAGNIDRGTNTYTYGSKATPTKKVAIAGDQIQCEKLLPIPAGATVTLWESSTADPTFVFMRLCLADQTGFLDIYYKADKPTDIVTVPNNLTPLGTCMQWHQAGLSCNTDWRLNTQSIQVNPTLATAAGDSAGLPGIAASGATVEGRVYKVVVKNRGASAVMLSFTKLD